MMFRFVLSLKSLIAAISQSSASPALIVPNRSCGTLVLVPMVWLFMFGKDSAPSGRASWSVLDMNPVCFVFAVGYTIYMFMPFTVTQDIMVNFMPVSLTLWVGYSQLMIKQYLSLLVMQMLITLSGWSRSLLLIGTGVMLLIYGICLVVSSFFTVPPFYSHVICQGHASSQDRVCYQQSCD